MTASVTKDATYALGFITDTSFAFNTFSVYAYANPLAAVYPLVYLSPPTIPVPHSRSSP